MTQRACVQLYFDFISPYAWLGLNLAQRLARGTGPAVDWRLQPVVYGVLLDRHGLVGPVETEAKRRYTFQDVARCARREGLPLAGPPAHPFRSLDALRTVCLFRDEPNLLDLAVGLANACWSEGRSLADVDVLASVVEAVGLDAGNLAARLGAAEIKAQLRDNTEQAIEGGIFGVPTFVHGAELFWGHDRVPDLVARLAGEPGPDPDTLEALLERPRAAERRGSPHASD